MKKLLLGIVALFALVSSDPAVAQYIIYPQPQPIILVPVYPVYPRYYTRTTLELRTVFAGYDYYGYPVYQNQYVWVTRTYYGY